MYFLLLWCVCVLQMTGYAAFKSNRSLAEQPIAVTVRVQDMNDNAPVFKPMPPVSIYEDSPVGVSSSTTTTFNWNFWVTVFSVFQVYSHILV